MPGPILANRGRAWVYLKNKSDQEFIIENVRLLENAPSACIRLYPEKIPPQQSRRITIEAYRQGDVLLALEAYTEKSRSKLTLTSWILFWKLGKKSKKA